jgi:hypothetical protein
LIQPSLNFEPFQLDQIWRETLSAVLKPFSRSHIAEQLESLTGQKCSEPILNNWSAPSNSNHRTPAIFVPAICEATQTTALYDLLGRPIRSLLNRSRMEEISRLQDEQRRIETRLAELERKI